MLLSVVRSLSLGAHVNVSYITKATVLLHAQTSVSAQNL